jgi:transposase
VKSLESQRLKTPLAARKALLRRPIDLENEVHAPLKAYGFKLPAQIFHARFDDMARRAVIADPALAEALGPLLDTRSHLYRAFLGIDKRVRSIAHDDPICQLLMSAPGIGFVAARTFKAAVDDPKRFRRSKRWLLILGSSGEKDNPGHISKADDVEVRRPCSWRPAPS